MHMPLIGSGLLDNETFGQQTIQASGKLPRETQQLGITPLDSRF
jgi:hypothetical protein